MEIGLRERERCRQSETYPELHCVFDVFVFLSITLILSISVSFSLSLSLSISLPLFMYLSLSPPSSLSLSVSSSGGHQVQRAVSEVGAKPAMPASPLPSAMPSLAQCRVCECISREREREACTMLAVCGDCVKMRPVSWRVPTGLWMFVMGGCFFFHLFMPRSGVCMCVGACVHVLLSVCVRLCTRVCVCSCVSDIH